LPHSAYFLDALFSSGNAHALHGIQRLARILVEHWSRPTLENHLVCYERALLDEIEFLDRLIHGCFQTLTRFDLFVSYTMYYFAGAITCEKRRRAAMTVPSDGFFLAHDPVFRRGLEESYQAIAGLAADAPLPPGFADEFLEQVSRSISPFNTAGLADPAKANMYPFM
jgi:FADH2 O2-dependent halogenase